MFTRLKGRRAEALQALRWLRGKEFDVEPELNKLEKSVEVEMATVTHASDLLKPWAYKPILTALGLMSFQQIIGINAALFNAVDIFTAAKSDLDGLVSAILLNGIQVTPSPYSPPSPCFPLLPHHFAIFYLFLLIVIETVRNDGGFISYDHPVGTSNAVRDLATDMCHIHRSTGCLLLHPGYGSGNCRKHRLVTAGFFDDLHRILRHRFRTYSLDHDRWNRSQKSQK